MKTIFNPCVYQGPKDFKHKKGYFEGWYFKLVSHKNKTLAIIPGVSLNKKDPHGFIQVINGNTGKASYSRFALNEVQFTPKPFSVRIGNNLFTLDKLELGDRIPAKGKICLSGLNTYPATLLRPGIMGWYRYVPGMECYHGLISSGHDLSGEINYENEIIDFRNGRGYLEKDWGTSFPESYIWMQSNSFSHKDISFMLSSARIPWFSHSFQGFLGYLDMGPERITFSTHTNSVLLMKEKTGNSVTLVIEGRGNPFKDTLKRGDVLMVHSSRTRSGELMAPRIGSMERRISESIDAEISIELQREGKTVFSDRGNNGGFEIVNQGVEE